MFRGWSVYVHERPAYIGVLRRAATWLDDGAYGDDTADGGYADGG